MDEPLLDDDYTRIDMYNQNYFIWYNKLPYFPNVFFFH